LVLVFEGGFWVFRFFVSPVFVCPKKNPKPLQKFFLLNTIPPKTDFAHPPPAPFVFLPKTPQCAWELGALLPWDTTRLWSTWLFFSFCSPRGGVFGVGVLKGVKQGGVLFLLKQRGKLKKPPLVSFLVVTPIWVPRPQAKTNKTKKKTKPPSGFFFLVPFFCFFCFFFLFSFGLFFSCSKLDVHLSFSTPGTVFFPRFFFWFFFFFLSL